MLIGENISIKVVEIRGKQVRLGIKAPKETKIHREEVYMAIQEQNKEAITASPASLQDVSKAIKG